MFYLFHINTTETQKTDRIEFRWSHLAHSKISIDANERPQMFENNK